jgi:hypothetical protein
LQLLIEENTVEKSDKIADNTLENIDNVDQNSVELIDKVAKNTVEKIDKVAQVMSLLISQKNQNQEFEVCLLFLFHEIGWFR